MNFLLRFWDDLKNIFEEEPSSEDPVYDPVHVAGVLVVSLVVLGALFWLLWALLVCEGGEVGRQHQVGHARRAEAASVRAPWKLESGPMGLFDVHAHLTHPKLAGQLDDVLDRASQAGLTTIIANGLNPDDNLAVRELASQQDMIKAARRPSRRWSATWP